MVAMNVFRVLGDVSHTVSKCILIWAIHSNKSAEGVSLITQALYAAVFCTRYLDLFYLFTKEGRRHFSMWNFVLKNFYILSSFYIIFLMMRVYARTREREKAWKMGAYCSIGSLIAAPVVAWIFKKWEGSGYLQTLWTFSIILESVCVLPQLLLLRQTTVPTVIDSFYLLTLGSYRAFYIINWIERWIVERHFGPIEVLFGIIQTAFYIDFAWVYWTRQRVKLRNGGVVDSEDLSRGWLVSRLLGRGRGSLDEEEQPAIGPNGDSIRRPVRNGGRWGARGISVSADEGALDAPEQIKQKVDQGGSATKDNERAAGILQRDRHDTSDDDSDDDTLPYHNNGANGTTKGSVNGAVWEDEGLR